MHPFTLLPPLDGDLRGAGEVPRLRPIRRSDADAAFEQRMNEASSRRSRDEETEPTERSADEPDVRESQTRSSDELGESRADRLERRRTRDEQRSRGADEASRAEATNEASYADAPAHSASAARIDESEASESSKTDSAEGEQEPGVNAASPQTPALPIAAVPAAEVAGSSKSPGEGTAVVAPERVTAGQAPVNSAAAVTEAALATAQSLASKSGATLAKSSATASTEGESAVEPSGTFAGSLATATALDGSAESTGNQADSDASGDPEADPLASKSNVSVAVELPALGAKQPAADGLAPLSLSSVDATQNTSSRVSVASETVRPEAAASAERALYARDAERAADVLRQVRVSLSPQLREATIQLHPATLGRIQIRISMREGRLHAEMRAENPDALQALSRHEPELRAALASHGIHAEQFDLALGFGDPRRGAGDHAAHNRRSGESRVERLALRSGGELDPLTSTSARGVSASGVDTYA